MPTTTSVADSTASTSASSAGSASRVRPRRPRGAAPPATHRREAVLASRLSRRGSAVVPTSRKRRLRRQSQPGSELERCPVVLAPAERHEYAVAARRHRRAPRAKRRPLESASRIVGEIIGKSVVRPLREHQEHELDVVGRCEPNGVSARPSVVNTAAARVRRQRCAPRGQRGGRVASALSSASRRAMISSLRLRACERLGDRQQLVELDVVRGRTSTARSVSTSPPAEVQRRILRQDRALELMQRAAWARSQTPRMSASRVLRYTSSASACLPDR